MPRIVQNLPSGTLLLSCVSLLHCEAGLVPYQPDGPAAAVQITDIDPDWGPAEGRTAVTITGTGFAGSVVVFFGDDLASASITSDHTILASSPTVATDGPVDVRVLTDEGEATVAGGFRYGNTDPDPDPDPGDTDDPVIGTGLTGGLVEFTHQQGVAGDVVSAAAKFHDPADVDWLDWLPPVGSCVVDPFISPPAVTAIDVGEWVHLSSGSTSIPMARSFGEDGYLYRAANLEDHDYLRNASFDVSAPGEFTVEDALSTTEGYSSIEPIELLYVIGDSPSFEAKLRKSTTNNFTWAPAGQGTFLIQLLVFDQYGTTIRGTVMCHDWDDGDMSIPGAWLTPYPTNGLVLVYMFRYRTGEFVLPTNGSRVQTSTYALFVGSGIVKN